MSLKVSCLEADYANVLPAVGVYCSPRYTSTKSLLEDASANVSHFRATKRNVDYLKHLYHLLSKSISTKMKLKPRFSNTLRALWVHALAQRDWSTKAWWRFITQPMTLHKQHNCIPTA